MAKDKPKLSSWYVYTGKGGNRHNTRRHMTQAYKDRLVRGGISYSDYKKGVNLSKARGHGHTPEQKLNVSNATPEQRTKYKNYVAKREGDEYVFTTTGVKGPFPREKVSRKDERMIGGHWKRIDKALNGDLISIIQMPSFAKVTVGGYNGIPKMHLEYRMDEIERAQLSGLLPDKPFTIGSD